MLLVKRLSPRSPFLVNSISTAVVVRNNDGDSGQNPDSIFKKSQNTKIKSVRANEKKNTLSSNVADEITKEGQKKANASQKLRDVKVKASKKNKLKHTLPKSVASKFKSEELEVDEELVNYYRSLFSKGKIKDDSIENHSEFQQFQENPKKQEPKQSKDLIFMNVKEGLGIFKAHELIQKKTSSSTFWEELEAKELSYLSKTFPTNHFEEMIIWTNEGKLWHFPIDNDQGRYEEAKVHFTEHVFLEEHLESWCPKLGPLRHFMELVLVGLSKNPYLTVEDKKEHIQWFRDYFEKKKKLLTEVGAFQSTPLLKEAQGKIKEE